MSVEPRPRAAALPTSGLLPEDLLRFAWLERLAITPSGTHVAYTVRRPDVEANAYTVRAYMLELQTRQSRALTSVDGQVGALAWSRDGVRLACVWTVELSTIIEVIDPSAGERRRYPVDGAPPTSLDWSPDGRRLAMSRWTRAMDHEYPCHLGVPKPTVRVLRRLRYKQDGAGWVHDHYRQIRTLDLGTSEWHQCTTVECDRDQPRWSWDGRSLAFVAVAREQDVPKGYGQILIQDVASGAIRALMRDWQGAAVSPQWRADDRAIAFAGHNHPPPVHRRMFHHVWLHDLVSGTTHDLTTSLDQTVGNYAISDQRSGLSDVAVTWPEGHGDIYFLLTEQGATALYRVSESGNPASVVQGPFVVFGYGTTSQGRIIYGMADPTNVGDLYMQEDDCTERLTHLNPWLASRVLARPQSYHYEGLDGNRVHAWEMVPADTSLELPLPTIVYVHCSMFSWDFSHEFQSRVWSGLRAGELLWPTIRGVRRDDAWCRRPDHAVLH